MKLTQALILRLVLVGALTLFVLCLALSSQQMGEAAVSPAATIVMTEEGFRPQRITVAKGSTVRFENRGSGLYWPASNSHPTHELYSAFDPRTPIAPGEYWDFTFTERGFWAFHDHLRPNLRGIVTVTE